MFLEKPEDRGGGGCKRNYLTPLHDLTIISRAQFKFLCIEKPEDWKGEVLKKILKTNTQIFVSFDTNI